MPGSLHKISNNKHALARINSARKIVQAVLENVTPDAQEAIDVLSKMSASIVFAVAADPAEFKDSFDVYMKLMKDANQSAPTPPAQ